MSRSSVSLVGLVAGGGSGVARYTVALARALDEVGGEFPDLNLSLVTTVAGAQAVGARRLAVRDFRLRGRRLNAGPSRIAAEQVLAAVQRTDLLHFFDLTGPLLRPRAPFTATLHDASVMYGFRRSRHAYKRRVWPWALRRARRVVAVSAFAKEEATRFFGTPAERIVVVHSGPGLVETGAPAADARDLPQPPFLLYVGNLAASKNLPFLVRAFDRSRVDARLLLVGRRDDGYEELRAEIDRSSHPDRIRVVHDASDGELDLLYRSAAGLLLPSRYEGFGFTPLEAMARGCPVLASDIPPVREVSGEGALLLPLDDEQAWSAAIERVIGDEAAAAELRERGRRLVARYSWHSTARALCEVFRQATAEQRR